LTDAPDPDTRATLRLYSDALADDICAVLPTWVTTSVHRVISAWVGEVPTAVGEAAEGAAEEALADTGEQIRRLLGCDIDDQRTTPMALLRGAVRYPTTVLRAAGVPPVERDRFAESTFPDDDYDLTPSNWSDVDPSLAEPGIAWGAAKALEHKRRHRGPNRPSTG
jgi:hypothetical protein